MKRLFIALLFALTLPAHATDPTPFAWAHGLAGTFIVLLKERCEFLTNMRQFIVVDIDHRILAGGCWAWYYGDEWIVAREGSTLRPIHWPASQFKQWKDLSR